MAACTVYCDEINSVVKCVAVLFQVLILSLSALPATNFSVCLQGKLVSSVEER